MNIVLLIRRSKEYYLEGKMMNYLSQHRYMWNLFYKLPYIEFRRRLAEIASSTYLANKFDRIYLWEEYKEINREGNIVVPIDEDDWISSSLVKELRDFDFHDKPVTTWKVLKLNCRHNRGVQHIKWNNAPSCGFAIKTPYISKCISHADLMLKHLQDTIKLDKILSVKVDNFSSISHMENKTIHTLLDYMQSGYLVEKVALLHEYEQQVDLYNELLTELYDSCKV